MQVSHSVAKPGHVSEQMDFKSKIVSASMVSIQKVLHQRAAKATKRNKERERDSGRTDRILVPNILLKFLKARSRHSIPHEAASASTKEHFATSPLPLFLVCWRDLGRAHFLGEQRGCLS